MRRELNRIEKTTITGVPTAVRESLEKSVSFLKEGKARLEKTIREHIDQHPELLFDKIGQARPGLKLDLGQEDLEVFLNQPVEDGFFGTPPLVVDAFSGRRRLISQIQGCIAVSS